MKPFYLLIALIFFSFISNAQTDINDPQNMLVKVDQEAHYPGGEMALFYKMYEKIKWPEVKLGVVDDYITVSFNVLTDSTVADIAVLKGIDPLVDKEVTKVLKTIKFAPSIQMGTVVKMNLMMDIPVRWRFE